MPRADPDRAARGRVDPELSRLEAEHEARRLKISSGYRAHIADIRSRPIGLADVLWSERTGRQVMTEHEALAEEARLLNEESVRFERELRTLALKRELQPSWNPAHVGPASPEDELAAMEAAWRKCRAAFYGHRTIEEAVRQVVLKRRTRNDLAKTHFTNPKDATRARRMIRIELFGLNESGKLWVDRRVRQRNGREIALRYWNDQRWVDPLDPPGSDPGMGRT